jgi:hypothetical protein
MKESISWGRREKTLFYIDNHSTANGDLSRLLSFFHPGQLFTPTSLMDFLGQTFRAGLSLT